MPGMLDWKIKISADIKDLQNKMHKVEGKLGEFEGKDHKVKLDLDTKTLESALKKLDSMLDSLGKGTGDFKQFETLSKDLAKVTSELSGFTKAFGKIDNSGTKSLLDMVQNIDKSLNNLSSHVTDEFLNKITSSVGTVKQKFADIGDGSEFEPLLQMINKIDSSINNLAKETSKIKLNMNLDFGTEMSEKMNQQVSKAVSRQAQAYKNLFEIMKGSGKTTEEMIKFSLPENASNSEIVGAYKGVIERAEKQYGKSTYSLRLGSKYNDAKNEIKNANAALRRAEIKRTNSNGVSDLLGGNFGDVINELSKIAAKLDEISSSASGLKSAFETGFNVSASVEEIVQLTNKVKKLEDELQKVKSVSSGTVSTGVTLGNESNISSERKDAFPKTSENLEQVAQSEQKVQQEAVATDKALDNISFTPNTEEFEDIIAKFGILREQAEQITKIVKTTKQTADGAPDISYKATLKNGSSYYLGENSTPQVLNASETVYDAKAIAKNAEQEAKAIQAEWSKNLKAIQDYMDAVTKLNSLKAKDKGTGNQANQIALQIQNVEELKQVAFEARQNLSSMQAENPDIIAWKQWVDMMELFDQASKGSAESAAKLKDVLDNIKAPSLDKYENKLSSYLNKTGGYNATIARFNDGGWTSNAYLENVQAVKNAVKEYEDLLNELKGKDASLVTSEDINKLDSYEKKIKDTIATVTNMSAAEKGYNFVSGQKELDKIHKLLNENSKMSSEAKAKIKAYYAEIESGNPSMSLDRIHGEIMKIYNAEVEAGRAGKSLIDVFKTSRLHQMVAQVAGMFSVYDVINVIKQAASTVTELNTQITELAKVSEQSSKQIYADFDSYADIAKEVRGTISDTIAATADWSKNGYSIPDAKQLAEISQLYKNVGDGIDIDTANESLISTLKGFQLEADQAEHIVDVFNEVSNNEAISSGGIGEALQRSAASFNAANTSLEQSVALVTATNSVLQDPEKVGNMWKTVSARIRGKLVPIYSENYSLCA